MQDQFGFSEYEVPSGQIDKSKITPEILERMPSADESDLEYMSNFAEKILKADSKAFDAIDDLHPSHGRLGNWISHLYKNSEYAPYIEKMFQNLLQREGDPVESVPKNKRKKMEGEIDRLLQVNPDPIPMERDQKFFLNTNHERGFISRASNSKGLYVDNRPITQSLFGIPSFQIGEPPVRLQAAEEYIKSKVNGKTVVLLGGGNSVEDLVYNREITPEVIVNVDPHINKMAKNVSTPNPYKTIKAGAEDEDLIQKLKEVGVENADEIWASYSVPYYIDNAEGLKAMFENVKIMLAPGGTLRIYPFSIPSLVSEEAFWKRDATKTREIQQQEEERFEAYLETAKEINNDKEFNVSLVNTGNNMSSCTLIIQRCG